MSGLGGRRFVFRADFGVGKLLVSMQLFEPEADLGGGERVPWPLLKSEYTQGSMYLDTMCRSAGKSNCFLPERLGFESRF